MFTEGEKFTIAFADSPKFICERYAWTFNTSVGCRIKITFHQFEFEESNSLVIGDGPISDESTKLVEFTGTDIPSNVTSISNWLWISVRNESCCIKTPSLHADILSIREDSGKLFRAH